MQTLYVIFCYDTLSYVCCAYVLDGPGSEEIDDQDDVSAATHWLLPAAEMEGLWENLIFDRWDIVLWGLVLLSGDTKTRGDTWQVR